MRPLCYTGTESAKLLRYLLRREFPHVRCSVRTQETHNRREVSTGLLVSWETCGADAEIAALSQTFCQRVYSASDGDAVESLHYVGPDGDVKTVQPGSSIPTGRREVVFCVDYVVALPAFPVAVPDQQRPVLRLVYFSK